MKHFLRNLTLVGAVAMSATAFAQDANLTFTEKWSQKVEATSNPIRYGTGTQGKIYLFNKATGEILKVDENGSSVLTTVTGCNSITSDDAGNIIMKKGGFGSNNDQNLNYLIIPADGSANIDVTVTRQDPSEWVGRQDEIGRVTGDVMSETGGVFFATANGKSGALPIVIMNGEAQSEYSEYTPDNVAGLTAANTMSIANPITRNVEDLLAMDPLYLNGYYFRSDANYTIMAFDADQDKWTAAFTRPAPIMPQHGWDVFELGGETYQVAFSGSEGNWGGSWAIAKADGTVVYSKTSDAGAINGNGSAIVTRVKDENTVEVYVMHILPAVVTCDMVEVSLPQEQPKDLYICGGLTGWDPATPGMFNFADGAYTFDVTADMLASGDLGFKISTAFGDWDAFNGACIGVAEDNQTYTLQINNAETLAAGKIGNFLLPAAGTYTITVSADLSTLTLTGEAAPVEDFEHPEAFYVRGDVSGWAISEDYKMSLLPDRGPNGEYVYATADIALSGEFKICHQEDWNAGFGNFGRQNNDGTDGSMAVTVGGKYGAWDNCDNFKAVTPIDACQVKFYFVGKKKDGNMVEIANPSGVENIQAADNAQAVYYNLQGVEVNADQLNAGVYIKVAGGKASKVLVK